MPGFLTLEPVLYGSYCFYRDWTPAILHGLHLNDLEPNRRFAFQLNLLVSPKRLHVGSRFGGYESMLKGKV